MTTTPEPIKGVPRLEGNSTLTLRADHNALADWVKTNVGYFIGAGFLPVTENFEGRIVTAANGFMYVCTELPATWKLINPGEVRALVSAGRSSFTTLGDNDLEVVHDPLGMVNAASNTITVPYSGIYLVTFNMIQAGTTACQAGVYVNGDQRVNIGATGATGAPANPSGSAHLVLADGDVVTFKSSAAASTTFFSTSTASVVLAGTT